MSQVHAILYATRHLEYLHVCHLRAAQEVILVDQKRWCCKGRPRKAVFAKFAAESSFVKTDNLKCDQLHLHPLTGGHLVTYQFKL